MDDCKWFHEHSLMALSKLVSLENLSLYKCGNLNDSVAYMSITAKFGFRKLLVSETNLFYNIFYIKSPIYFIRESMLDAHLSVISS